MRATLNGLAVNLVVKWPKSLVDVDLGMMHKKG